MGCGKIFATVLAYISVIVIGVGSFADFVTTITWFNKIHPYFSHAKGEGKSIYISTICCSVFSLVTLAILVIYAIFSICCRSCFKIIVSSLGMTVLYVFILGCFILGSVISGVIASSLGLENYQESGFSYKCYGNYDLTPILEWKYKDFYASNQIDTTFCKWLNDFVEKNLGCTWAKNITLCGGNIVMFDKK